jgi:hypothetical protein
MVKSEHDQIEALDAQRIRNCLTDIRARMYRQALLQTVASTFFCGLILLAILFFFNRLIPLPMQMSSMSWIVMSVAGVAGVCLSLKHWNDLQFVAQVVDEKMELRERLGTAFGLIQSAPQGEFAQFQIRDAAETAATLDIRKISRYRTPKLLRLFPIPLLLIGLSFTIPPFYEIQQPLTESQQQVLDSVIQNLDGKRVKNPTLQKQLRDTVNRLKTATDFDTAQEHLGSLNREIRKQKSEQDVITKTTETSQRFRGMDADQLASELKDFTEQAEIPPELQAELRNLFERMAESLPEGTLHNSLNQIQGRTVTQESLQDIIDALQKTETLTHLAQLEAELIANRKELALADIETTTSNGGIANMDGTPGQNAGTREVQGRRETSSNLESLSTPAAANDGKMKNPTDEGNLTMPLTGDETQALQINGEQLTLTTAASGDSESFSGVFTGEPRADAPAYLPFSDVVLNAERAYAEAINNNRIPIKYRTQIKDYLKAIGKKNEKKLN